MWAIWTARTWERARTAARSPHPYAQWMLWHGSEIKLRTLGRFCQRGSGRWGACVCVFHLFMWTWVFHKRTHAPWLSEVPTSLCVCPSVSLHLFLTLYIPWLPAGPRVASLESMAQASTLKKCKAADQSGLERQCTQRPQCESLLLPQSPLFTRLSCSQHACVITPDGEQDSTQVPWSSLGVQQAQCWSQAAQQFQ